MRMFFGSPELQNKSDSIITLEEWLKIMGQLGEKVAKTLTVHKLRTIGNHARTTRVAGPSPRIYRERTTHIHGR